jgi:hypothetical protein
MSTEWRIRMEEGEKRLAYCSRVSLPNGEARGGGKDGGGGMKTKQNGDQKKRRRYICLRLIFSRLIKRSNRSAHHFSYLASAFIGFTLVVCVEGESRYWRVPLDGLQLGGYFFCPFHIKQ